MASPCMGLRVKGKSRSDWPGIKGGGAHRKIAAIEGPTKKVTGRICYYSDKVFGGRRGRGGGPEDHAKRSPQGVARRGKGDT